MKKALFVTVLICVIMCGCGNRSSVKPLLKGISFTANANYNDKNYVCDVTVDNSGYMSALVVEPKEISDMKFNFDGETVTSEYLGLKYETDIEKFPSGNVIAAIYNAFNGIDEEDLAYGEKSENYTVSGNEDGFSYFLTVSPSGLPLSLDLPDMNLKVEFQNVTVIN